MRQRRLRKQGGNAALEFGLALGLLVPMLSGLFTFGYSFYQYQLLQHAVRDGARYAALKNYDSLTSTPSSAYLTAVRNMTVYGTPTPDTGAKPLVRNLTAANVQLVITGRGTGSLTPPAFMTIRITGYTLDSVFKKQVLNGRPFATFPFTALVTPPI